MPTFIAYKKGEKIDTMTGAVPAKLTVSTTLFPLLAYGTRNRANGGPGFGREGRCLDFICACIDPA